MIFLVKDDRVHKDSPTIDEFVIFPLLMLIYCYLVPLKADSLAFRMLFWSYQIHLGASSFHIYIHLRAFTFHIYIHLGASSFHIYAIFQVIVYGCLACCFLVMPLQKILTFITLYLILSFSSIRTSSRTIQPSSITSGIH